MKILSSDPPDGAVPVDEIAVETHSEAGPDFHKATMALAARAREVGANAVVRVTYEIRQPPFWSLKSDHVVAASGTAVNLEDAAYEAALSDAESRAQNRHTMKKWGKAASWISAGVVLVLWWIYGRDLLADTYLWRWRFLIEGLIFLLVGYGATFAAMSIVLRFWQRREPNLLTAEETRHVQASGTAARIGFGSIGILLGLGLMILGIAQWFDPNSEKSVAAMCLFGGGSVLVLSILFLKGRFG